MDGMPSPVRHMGFGAMQLPGPGVFGPPKDRALALALAVIRRAADAGVNHIDTAQFYGPDVANELLHEALHPGSDVPFADQLEEMIALRDVLDQAALHALPS
jgi:aryl-alcohol dehydrogenase-like predicted oxidoreductase